MTRRGLPEVKVHADWHKSESGCWSLTLGWRGCRVRVMQRKPGGSFYAITWIAGRGQDWKSLRTKSRSDAQERAETFIRAQFENDTPVSAHPLTLGELWNLYQQKAASYQRNTEQTRYHKGFSAEHLIAAFGATKRVEHLTHNDVERYYVMRRTGRGWPDGRKTSPVRRNAIRHDVGFLRTMILWATHEKVSTGAWLLAENPLRGLKIPREENPKRPVATYDRFLSVRKAMQELATTAPQARGRERWARMELALVIAEATGARIGAIRGLRWSDIEFDSERIRWRPEFDKRGRERLVPIPASFAEELHGFRVRLGVLGDGWLFPCVERDEPWPREIFGQQLCVAEQRAGVPPLDGGRWHAYRRKWATERGDVPLKALMVAGGWKDMQTLITCYQQPTDDALLKVMAHPVKLREHAVSSG